MATSTYTRGAYAFDTSTFSFASARIACRAREEIQHGGKDEDLRSSLRPLSSEMEKRRYPPNGCRLDRNTRRDRRQPEHRETSEKKKKRRVVVGLFVVAFHRFNRKKFLNTRIIFNQYSFDERCFGVHQRHMTSKGEEERNSIFLTDQQR